MKLFAYCVGAALFAGLTACSSRDADLDRFIESTKKEPGGHVEALREVKPYESFVYPDKDLRSPFMPGGSGASSAGGPRPISNRNREFLEQYPLDTLKMVGTLNLDGNNYGLLQARDGRVHRVVVGNYVGQNDGRITAIAPSKINVMEVVPDGLGGYIERPAALGLNE
jgi:type IV pilus assembly protein PilP